jgi:hypothetical protein
LGDEEGVVAGVHQLLLAVFDGGVVEAAHEDAAEGLAGVAQLRFVHLHTA